jgi:pilus assembly protein Flp/PilA
MFKKYQVARQQEGASAIEYALIAGLIALAIIVGATALGGGLSTFFSGINTKVSSTLPAPAPAP